MDISHMYMNNINIYDKNDNPATKKTLKTLTRIIKIYSQEKGVEFGIEKCAMLIMKKKKIANKLQGEMKEKVKNDVPQQNKKK